MRAKRSMRGHAELPIGNLETSEWIVWTALIEPMSCNLYLVAISLTNNYGRWTFKVSLEVSHSRSLNNNLRKLSEKPGPIMLIALVFYILVHQLLRLTLPEQEKGLWRVLLMMVSIQFKDTTLTIFVMDIIMIALM